MKRQIRTNGSESVVIENSTFSRLYLQVNAIGRNNEVSASNKTIDLTRIRISYELTQKGKTTTSSHNLVGPVALSSLKNRQYDYFGSIEIDPTTGTTCKGRVIEAGGDGFPVQTLLTVPLLDGGIRLTGDDKLIINIDCLSNLFSADFDANGKVYMCTEQSVDTNQFDMCLPVFYPLTFDKQSPNFNEPAVNEICVLSTQVNGGDESLLHNAVQNIDVKSSFYSERFDLLQLRSKQSLDTPQQETNNFGVFFGGLSTLDNVEIALDVDVQQLMSGTDFLYIKRAVFNPHVTVEGISHDNKVSANKVINRGVGSLMGLHSDDKQSMMSFKDRIRSRR